MIEFVNGIEIGWDGITDEEALEQRRLAALPERPLGRATDLRCGKPYGRLLPLYPVIFDKKCATRSLRWLCRCTCVQRKLVVVLALNLTSTSRPSRSCGCWHSIRASQNLAALKTDADFKEKQAYGAGESLRRYHRENPEVVRKQSRQNGLKVNRDPEYLARRDARFRLNRIERGFDPDVPLSTYRVQIRHAIAPLTKYIMSVRDDFTCALCLRRGKVRFAVHHNIPVEADWARVGDPRNLITLCARCHLRDAHAGRWKTIGLAVQAKLLAIAGGQEDAFPSPEGLVQMVQARLDVLGRKIGRGRVGFCVSSVERR